MTANNFCCHPGCKSAHDGWPAPPNLDGHLCQNHWEEASAAQWWDMCRAIDEADLMVWPDDAESASRRA